MVKKLKWWGAGIALAAAVLPGVAMAAGPSWYTAPSGEVFIDRPQDTPYFPVCHTRGNHPPTYCTPGLVSP